MNCRFLKEGRVDLWHDVSYKNVDYISDNRFSETPDEYSQPFPRFRLSNDCQKIEKCYFEFEI